MERNKDLARIIVKYFKTEKGIKMLIDEGVCVSKAEAKRVYCQLKGKEKENINED